MLEKLDRKALFKQELERLADELIGLACHVPEGYYWITLHREPYGPVQPAIREAIYNGNVGILLFFVDSYRFTGKMNYLEMAEKGCAYWLAQMPPQERAYYTLYTGWMGLVLLCLRLYEVTKKKYYLREASLRVAAWEEPLLNVVPLDDLISGHAGNVLVLAQLYAYTDDPAHEQLLRLLINKLIAGAKLSRRGLKWGYKTNALDSFMGMSHGAAGIGHVLLQLYAFTGEEVLRWMGEKAFRYEGEYYSREMGSWVDLRIFPEHKEMDLLREKGVPLYFAKRAELNTWAHGLAGMGLARLAAYRISGRKWLLQEAERCVAVLLKQMKEIGNTNFTLSTGYGAWIALLMEMYRVSGKKVYLDHADELLFVAMDSAKQQGFYASAWFLDRGDPALMVGTAGMASLLLYRLYCPRAPEILLPEIRCEEGEDSGRHLPLCKAVKVSLLRKYFRDTFALLEEAGLQLPEVLHQFSFRKGEWSETLTVMARWIADMPYTSRKSFLMQTFRWERRVFWQATDPEITLYRELRAKQFMEAAMQVDNWTDEWLDTYSMVRSRHVCLGHAQLVRYDADESRRFKLSYFSEMLLRNMGRPLSLPQLTARMASLVNEDERVVLQGKIRMQLRAFVKQWLIELTEIKN